MNFQLISIRLFALIYYFFILHIIVTVNLVTVFSVLILCLITNFIKIQVLKNCSYLHINDVIASE
jgi:hypothetical protein